MKKIKALVLLVVSIIASALILTACCAGGGGGGSDQSETILASGDGDGGGATMSDSADNGGIDKYTAGDTEVTDEIDSIDVVWEKGSVSIVSNNTKNVLVREESNVDLDDDHKLKMWVEGTTLTIRYDNVDEPLDSTPEKRLTITIPSDIEFRNVNVNTGAGVINIGELCAYDADFSSAAGNINIESLYSDDAEIEAAAGNISISNLESYSTDITTTAGFIKIAKLYSIEADIKSDAGDIDIISADSTELSVASTSGSIDVKEMLSSDAEFDAASGSVSIISTEVPYELEIETISGDVSLTLPKDSDFTAEINTVSGEMSSDIPVTNEDGLLVSGYGTSEIKIETTSGNIKIKPLD